MKNRIIAATLLLSGVALLGGCNRSRVSFNTAPAEEQTVRSTVTSTGFVQPVDKVDVGTQVSGIIEKINVDFNSHVKRGQLLAELDKSTLSEKVNQAEATLTSAKSDLTFSQQNYDRTKILFDQKAATQASWESAVNTLAQSKTNVVNAQASLDQARVQLSYAEIYSPIDGVVINRAVDQGQTVAASFNTPVLFTIANDLTKMQVEADVDEADIGQVRLGQKVEFGVDAFPDDTFTGTVQQIRLQPTVTNNVVTYTVIIEAPNPEEKLFPGMTANVTIITREERGVAILTEALNFHPTAQMLGRGAAAPADSLKGQGVWIQTAAGGLEHRAVTTGLSDRVNVIVESGLEAGDVVVLSVATNNAVPANKATNLFPGPPGSSSSSSRRTGGARVM